MHHRQCCRHYTARGKEAMIDCEHFFDGYKANRDYALACADAALQAGARWVVLCDTNGGSMPDEVLDIVSDVCKHIGGEKLGIHTHNDTEMVANSLLRLMPVCGKCRARLTGLANAAAMPIWSRLSRPYC